MGQGAAYTTAPCIDDEKMRRYSSSDSIYSDATNTWVGKRAAIQASHAASFLPLMPPLRRQAVQASQNPFYLLPANLLMHTASANTPWL